MKPLTSILLLLCLAQLVVAQVLPRPFEPLRPARPQTQEVDIEPISDTVNVDIGFKMVAFGATWCAPCTRMKPVYARLFREGLPILYTDFDTLPQLAHRFKVKLLPTIVFVFNGEEVGRLEGTQSYAQVVAKYNQLRDKYPPEPIPDSFPDTPVDLDEDDSGLEVDVTPEYKFTSKR